MASSRRGGWGRAAAALLGAVALVAGPAAAETSDPRVRMAFRSGVTFVEDASIHAVGDGVHLGGAELAADVRVAGGWWAGAAWSVRQRRDDVFSTIETNLFGQSLRLSAGYRHALLPWVVVYGRIGPSAWWYDVELRPDRGRRLADEDFTFGAHAGVGVDVLPLHADVLGSFLGGFAAGLSFEATYDRVLPIRFADEGTDLGEIDPSGPGLLVGLVVWF